MPANLRCPALSASCMGRDPLNYRYSQLCSRSIIRLVSDLHFFDLHPENRRGERTVSSAAPANDFRSSCQEVRPCVLIRLVFAPLFSLH